MRFIFGTAWRFLVSSKGQTVLITLGIAIGVAVQVFIGTLITGLQKSLVDTTIGSSSQVTVQPQKTDDRIQEYESLTDEIKADVGGVTQITAVADAAGFVKQGEDTWAVLFRGFDFDTADGIYKLEAALLQGGLPGDNELLLGSGLLEQSGLAVGDAVEMLTPEGETQSVTIAGEFDLQVADLNTSWAIAPRSLVQGAFGYGDEVTGIEMQVADVFAADTVASEVEKLLPPGLETTNWKQQNASLLSGLNGQSISSYMIQVFVLLSVILGIASVLVISVLQKSRQLGILKAIGIKNRSASLIFLFEGLLLGGMGSILGVGLGLGLSVLFTKFATNADGSPLVPLTISHGFILLSAVIAIAAAVLASIIPARRSARLDPIEVIQNG